MFRGTRNVPNYDIPLQEAGASSNAFTSEDLTVYIETVPSPYLERALYLEAERLGFLPSALDQAKFDTEREVVKNERRQSYENVPYGLAGETILANLFPEGHPYSWSVIGSMERPGPRDARRPEAVLRRVLPPGQRRALPGGRLRPGRGQGADRPVLRPALARPGRRRRSPPRPCRPVSRSVTLADRVQLPRVYWAWPAVADDHPDAPALDLLASILAGGEASRLHRALVLDARVATEVDADDDAKEIAGLFTVEATAAEGKTLAEVSRVLDAEIERVRSEPPSATELARVLAKYEKSTLLALTSPLSRAITLATGFVQKDDPADYRRDYARHVAVTADDVLRVAQKYLTPAKVVLDVEPIEDGQGQERGGHGRSPPRHRGRARDRRADPAQGRARLVEDARPVEPRVRSSPPSSSGSGSPTASRSGSRPGGPCPILTAQLILPAGTADDPAGKSGLATLTATLLDKGTKDLSAVELAEALEALGVTVSTGAGVDHTVVGFGVAARNLVPEPDPDRPDARRAPVRPRGLRARARAPARRPAPGARRPLLDRAAGLPRRALRPQASVRQPLRGIPRDRQGADGRRRARLPRGEARGGPRHPRSSSATPSPTPSSRPWKRPWGAGRRRRPIPGLGPSPRSRPSPACSTSSTSRARCRAS